jgi:polyphosphate kinase 2
MGKKNHKRDEEPDGDPQPATEKLKREVYEEKLAGAAFSSWSKCSTGSRRRGRSWCSSSRVAMRPGKGGAIKCVTEPLNPRGSRIVALGTPTEKERSQWYFQRYVTHLPAAGEIVLFDRSWYNRAGVERVMGFCSDEEYDEFMRSCPEFERMLVRSGIILLKYWFSVSDAEQEKRFKDRAGDPARRWKLSPMDLESMPKWVEYSRAKDEMFRHTDIKQAPWWTVEADNKRRARLNCIAHILSSVPYQDVIPPPLKLPHRRKPDDSYVRPPRSEQNYVPELKI